MDRKVVDVIKALPEQQLFMKGVLSWAGFNVAIVEYDRAPRCCRPEQVQRLETVEPGTGWSHLDSAPCRCGCGAISAAVFRCWRWCTPDIWWWTSVVWQCGAGVSVVDDGDLVLGGVQLIGIGILGEYVGGFIWRPSIGRGMW